MWDIVSVSLDLVSLHALLNEMKGFAVVSSVADLTVTYSAVCL